MSEACKILFHKYILKTNLKDQDLMITKKKFLKACDKLREDVKRKGILLKVNKYSTFIEAVTDV